MWPMWIPNFMALSLTRVIAWLASRRASRADRSYRIPSRGLDLVPVSVQIGVEPVQAEWPA